MKKAGLLFVFLILFIFLSMNFVFANQLKVTNNHPFLINGKWIEASQLQVGDYLTTIDGKKARITNIQDIETQNPFQVYNLEDSIFHNYIVGDDKVIVHNSNNKIWASILNFLRDETGQLPISPGEAPKPYPEYFRLLVEKATRPRERINAAELFKTIWRERIKTMKVTDPKQAEGMRIAEPGILQDIDSSYSDPQFNFRVSCEDPNPIATVGIKSANSQPNPSLPAQLATQVSGKPTSEIVHIATADKNLVLAYKVLREVLSRIPEGESAVAVVNDVDSARYLNTVGRMAKRISPNEPNPIQLINDNPAIEAGLKEYYNGKNGKPLYQRRVDSKGNVYGVLKFSDIAELEYRFIYIEYPAKVIAAIDLARGGGR